MELTFCGATEGVTGSLTFLRLPEGLVIIDCGMSQGSSEIEYYNNLPLPYEPKDIKAILLTHAHLDHSGLIPKLVKEGFYGSIYCTKPTMQLASIILKDSARIEDPSYYDEDDVTSSLKLFKTINFDESFSLLGASIKFFPAGHILGASSIKIKTPHETIVFSGDLGRSDDPLMPPPLTCPETDLLVMESTYGGRIRTGDIEKELYSFLIKVSREKRVGIIASFAIARGQMLMTLISDFFRRHPEDKIKVVFDSPMMARANLVYQNYSELTNRPQDLFFAIEDTEQIEYEGQWESLKKKKGPMLIISSSGMLGGGRIIRHLINWENDPSAILYLPGYQAKGTPGRELIEGKRYIKYDKNRVIQWKGEVYTSDAFSSHADQRELLNWAQNLKSKTQIFLIHGETSSKIELAKKFNQRGIVVKIPQRSEFYSY